QEVALRHPVAGDERLEHELERCEELEREAEREPAREVVVARAEALAPTDDATKRTSPAAATALAIAQSRRRVRPRANGAIATRAAPSMPPRSEAHSS